MLDLDQDLKPYAPHLSYQWDHFTRTLASIEQVEGSLENFARGYEEHGFTKSTETGEITVREWFPAANQAWVIGDFCDWKALHAMEKDDFGTWTITLPKGTIPHNTKVKLRFEIGGGRTVDRFSAWTKQTVLLEGNTVWDAVYWDPPKAQQYQWKHPRPKPTVANGEREVRIYEAHVGMAGEDQRVHTYREFADDVLPRIAKLGYNTVQLMAVMEHVYYGSFGYHVTSPFAAASRCGSPDDLKYLVDTGHKLGLHILLDVVHSHISKNVEDGLAGHDVGQDGSMSYFNTGERGYHSAWDSRLFNYSNWETLRYLLSNIRYWLKEFKFDGFRFDGVTSMLYHHHGINIGFSGDYHEYFGPSTNVDAVTYLMLANELTHRLVPDALSIAEDVSGMPGLCRPVREGGVGFDYRLNMAIPDFWIKTLKHTPDEKWGMLDMVHHLCNRRYTEKTVGYAESHDQALVGDKTIAMWLFDREIYDGMSTFDYPPTPVVARGMALHMMIRTVTCALGGEAWLNFMGNEFGHPEWIDFPTPVNNWSHAHCRRQWTLADTEYLRYSQLNAWDMALMELDQRFHFTSARHQHVSMMDEDRKVLVAERGPLVFVFNWHPAESYEELKVPMPSPGKYRCVLDNREWRFGADGGIMHDADHFTENEAYMGRSCVTHMYLPSRSVSVFCNWDEWGPPEDNVPAPRVGVTPPAGRNDLEKRASSGQGESGSTSSRDGKAEALTRKPFVAKYTEKEVKQEKQEMKGFFETWTEDDDVVMRQTREGLEREKRPAKEESQPTRDPASRPRGETQRGFGAMAARKKEAAARVGGSGKGGKGDDRGTLPPVPSTEAEWDAVVTPEMINQNAFLMWVKAGEPDGGSAMRAEMRIASNAELRREVATGGDPRAIRERLQTAHAPLYAEYQAKRRMKDQEKEKGSSSEKAEKEALVAAAKEIAELDRRRLLEEHEVRERETKAREAEAQQQRDGELRLRQARLEKIERGRSEREAGSTSETQPLPRVVRGFFDDDEPEALPPTPPMPSRAKEDQKEDQKEDAAEPVRRKPRGFADEPDAAEPFRRREKSQEEQERADQWKRTERSGKEPPRPSPRTQGFFDRDIDREDDGDDGRAKPGGASYVARSPSNDWYADTDVIDLSQYKPSEGQQ